MQIVVELKIYFILLMIKSFLIGFLYSIMSINLLENSKLALTRANVYDTLIL